MTLENCSQVSPTPFTLTATLTGWSDSADNSVDFADADTARLPFREQVDFFRTKLSLPTDTWTDIWQEQHDISFVVAGASRDALLIDLRSAVDSAVADGTTLEAFRERFDEIAQGHGWSYKGGRDWRTRVIYDTNLRTSYAAGRYKQMQQIKALRPYWRYRHNPASTEPRAEHLAWDGLVLDADDGWWNTHYPPNGWGCKCYVETLRERDLERLGKDGPDAAPSPKLRTATVGKGATARAVQVPQGISPGFAYAPGKSVTGAAQQHSITSMETLLRRAEKGSLPAGATRLFRASIGKNLASEPFQRFIRTTSAIDNQHWPVATLQPGRIKELGLPAQARAVRLSSASVESHRERFAGFAAQDWARVQRMIDDGRWVEDKRNHRTLRLNDGGKPWLAVLKRTAAGEVFLVSYRRAQK